MEKGVGAFVKGGWIEIALLLSGMCALARVGVSAGVRRTHEQASPPCACKCVCARSPVHMRGSVRRREWVCVCVLSVRACVRACNGERVAVVVGRRALHVQ